MPTTKPPAANGTGEEKRRTNEKPSEERFQMEVVEDETREEQPLSKGTDANGGKGKSTGNGNGVVNRAFEDEDSNKGAKSMNGGGAGIAEPAQQQHNHNNQQQQQQQRHHAALSNTTNGDVEMIPLTTSSVTPTNTPTPPGDRKKATNGQHKNAAASPQQKSSENNLKNASNELYSDYFMPVNNRRKLLRGQKLYVTRDQRAHKRGWKWIAFWGGVCTFVAAALLTGILAATGIIMSKEEPSFSGAQSLLSNETENTSTTWNSTKSDNDTDGHGVILEMDPFFGKSAENTSNTEPNPTTTIATFTESSPTSTIANTLQGELRLVDLDFNADFTDITSPSSQQLAKKIESELAKTFATMNIMKARVERFSQGSVIVHFLLTWPDHVYRVTPEQATTYFTDHLSINGDNFGSYRIDPDYFALKELTNRCEESNGGCSEFCHWSSADLRFMCSCSEGHVLDADGKTCATSSLSHPPTDTFHSTSHQDHTTNYEDTTTVTTDSTTPRTSSGSRGRQLIFGPDQEDITPTNDTYTSESSEPYFPTVTTPELIHEVEPEPSETTPVPESTPHTLEETHDTHFGFGFDGFNYSTSDTLDGNDTVTVTTFPREIHETVFGNDNDTSHDHDHNQTNSKEVQDVTTTNTTTDSTFPFTFTTISTHEMEQVNFTIPALTEDDDHMFFGSNVSLVTDETTSSSDIPSSDTTSEPHFTNSNTNFTVATSYMDDINVNHTSVNASSEDEHLSTLGTDNDNFTMSMMVTKPEWEEETESSSSNHSTTGHGWDSFSHMLTTLNEATAIESEETITTVTESYHGMEMNSSSSSTSSDATSYHGNLTEIPETTSENVTTDFNVQDFARMFPNSGGEDAQHADVVTTPSSLPEPMSVSENHTEPTIELMLNTTTNDGNDDDESRVTGVTENTTSPWTAVTYQHLYQQPNTTQEVNPTTPELLTINSTLELVPENSFTSQTLTLSHTTGENTTALNTEDESTQSSSSSSSTNTETVASFSTNSSTDYLTGFSNHETSDSMELTTVAEQPYPSTQ